MHKNCAKIETDQIIEVILNEGPKGENGLSAYEIAVKNGYIGTEEEWLESLKGPAGKDGADGADGKDGKDGIDGKDAKINGMNTLNIVEGKNIKIEQTDTTLKIENTYEFDDSDIQRDINTLSDAIDEHDREIVGIDNSIADLQNSKADKNEIPDVSEFVKRTVDDLINYYKKTETYTQEEVNQLLSTIKTGRFEVVETLPEVGEENVIYLVKKAVEEEKDIYYEYIYINNAYELIGSTEIDLSNYYTKDEINTLLFDYITSNDLEEVLKDYVTISMKYDFVKDGLVNNTNELSDEEQLKIEQWLGLDQNYITFSNTKAYTPSENYNPTPKKYVDDVDKALRERISEIELSKFPNVTIFGTPTIQQGQVSDFSLNDYLEFPFLVDFRGRSFEINFMFTTGTDIDNQQNILDSEFGLAFAIRNKHFVMALSYNGTSWATEQTGNLTLETQKTYRVKISWSGLVYRVQYSTDGGTTYNDDIQFGGTTYPYPRQMYIGVGKLAQNYFKGSINLNYADVLVEGNKIWMGMDDAGLALRADINLENITPVAEQKIKDLAGGGGTFNFLGVTTDFPNNNPLILNDLEVGKAYTMLRNYGDSPLFYVKAIIGDTEITTFVNGSVGVGGLFYIYLQNELPSSFPSRTTTYGYIYFQNETNESHVYMPVNISSSGLNIQRFVSKDIIVTKVNDATIDSQISFSKLPRSSPMPTLDNQLTNKKYVDDQIASAIGNIDTVLQQIDTGEGI